LNPATAAAANGIITTDSMTFAALAARRIGRSEAVAAANAAFAVGRRFVVLAAVAPGGGGLHPQCFASMLIAR
jgi:hypothetical protein